MRLAADDRPANQLVIAILLLMMVLNFVRMVFARIVLKAWVSRHSTCSAGWRWKRS